VSMRENPIWQLTLVKVREYQFPAGSMYGTNNSASAPWYRTERWRSPSRYFTVDTAAKKVIVNQASFKSAAMISGHPTFDAVNNAGMIALKKFFDLTDARLTANQCDPPRLKD